MLLLVDGNNLFMRAFHATRHEAMTADGESTAALVVFANTLLRHIREEAPDRVVVCWDGGGSSYRTRILPSYKANRHRQMSMRDSPQRLMIKEFLALAGIMSIERTGVEADDLIAKYWYEAEERIILVSEDKDFFQLAGWNPNGYSCEILRSTGERWDRFTVEKKTGASPENLPKVMALTGDVSDNVLGVPGIGPVRAVQLLQGADWRLEAIEDPKVREMLPQVLLNRVLVNLRLPLPRLDVAPAPEFRPTVRGTVLYDSFVSFLEEHRLKGLLGRCVAGTLWSDDSPSVEH